MSSLTPGMFQDLRKMLEGWGIKADDWYLTGEAAMLVSGYPVDFREGQIDILTLRETWPWPREEEQVSLFPDKGTQAADELDAFVAKHGILPDFHPLPHVGINAEDRFEHASWHPDEQGVRVLKPWAGIYHRELIITFFENDPKGLHVFDQAKFIRWKKFVEQTRGQAVSLSDQETVTMCDRVLPIVERAIAFFDTQTTDEVSENILKGSVAYEGHVTGPAQHWNEGADFSGKVAVLTHLLPSQVTLIRNAAAMVTDQGGLLSHAATVAREYNIPTIIGTKHATKRFKDGDLLEVDGGRGLVVKLM
jgi:phosphohistidine swiveling domain-containing protein